ncbi:MAG TPA: type III secretion system gatekeeper subunit SctW [Usitatibacter sp.]|nr:type III secretion system gatekeeper subunit SctW [Usitatibacter sp.]
MIRIDGASPQNLSPNIDARPAPAQTGAWKGESLHVMDTSKSVLQDAAEEITMAGSDKADSKRLQERKAGPAGGLELQKLEEVMKYLESMHQKDGKEKLQDTAQRILQGRREGASPREEARRSFEDVTEQFAALTFAAHKGAAEGADPARLEAIHDALAEMQDDFGPQIRSGLAAAAGAREFATDAAGADRFRGTYRDVVLGEADLGKTFDALVTRHGLADFPRIVPALIKSLGEDLSAVRPSREPERLQAILQDLYNLEVAVTIHDQAKELAATLERRAAARV